MKGTLFSSVAVGHLFAVVSRMQFHEPHVVFHGNGTEDRRPHALTVCGNLPASRIEFLVRRFKASASLRRRRGSTCRIHRLVGLRLWERRIPQHPLEQKAPDDGVNDTGELWKL
jgi:hypothetical protein